MQKFCNNKVLIFLRIAFTFLCVHSPHLKLWKNFPKLPWVIITVSFMFAWLTVVSRYDSLWSKYFNDFKHRLHVSSCWRCSKHISSRQYKLVCHPQQKLPCWASQTESACNQKVWNYSSTSEFFSDWLGLHEKRFNLDWRCNSNLLCLQRGYWGASGFGVIQQI